ncbi:MAG: hypothetical protein EKK57_08305 [Proteobacteria bacterium]|nr:MAG: hypothetical protein EKK57_08305 [Pseudomonadota bacterium]
MAITYAEFLEIYTKIEQAAIKVVECFKLPAHIVDKVVMFGTTHVMDLAISEIKINTSGIVLSLVVPAKVELTTGTHIVILYGMFGSKSGYMLRCRLDEVHPEYLRCSF